MILSLDLASFLWGAAMVIACFTFVKAVRQTRRSWMRTHKANAYIFMVWLEWITCVVLSVVCWLYLAGIVPGGFGIFFGILILWTIQIQCLCQILCNRLSLLIFNPNEARRLKLGVGLAIGLINVSVFCIWIPARLQISETFIHVNQIWDRVEKTLFLMIDGSLNVCFMWMVRTKLIANGMTKYKQVYRFNLFMMFVSLSLDVLIIALMSWKNDAIYMQAHPLTYLAKLYVEMNLAELLGKVIKKSRERRRASYLAATSPLRRTATIASTATTPTPTSDSSIGDCPHFHHSPLDNEMRFNRNQHINTAGAGNRRGSVYTGGELYNYFAHVAPGGDGRSGDALDDATGLFSSAERAPAVSRCVNSNHGNSHRGRNGPEAAERGGHTNTNREGGTTSASGDRKESAGSIIIVVQQEEFSSSSADDREEEGEDHRKTSHDR